MLAQGEWEERVSKTTGVVYYFNRSPPCRCARRAPRFWRRLTSVTYRTDGTSSWVRPELNTPVSTPNQTPPDKSPQGSASELQDMLTITAQQAREGGNQVCLRLLASCSESRGSSTEAPSEILGACWFCTSELGLDCSDLKVAGATDTLFFLSDLAPRGGERPILLIVTIDDVSYLHSETEAQTHERVRAHTQTRTVRNAHQMMLFGVYIHRQTTDMHIDT